MATMKNYTKYKPGYYPPPQDSFEWVKKDHVTTPPRWCSVDLRDGNQALIEPMTLQEKLDMFKFLCRIGFKEIEVGFPAASDTEYEFIRRLVKDDLIPDDVVIQVLTQSRRHIIDNAVRAFLKEGCRTFDIATGDTVPLTTSETGDKVASLI